MSWPKTERNTIENMMVPGRASMSRTPTPPKSKSDKGRRKRARVSMYSVGRLETLASPKRKVLKRSMSGPVKISKNRITIDGKKRRQQRVPNKVYKKAVTSQASDFAELAKAVQVASKKKLNTKRNSTKSINHVLSDKRENPTKVSVIQKTEIESSDVFEGFPSESPAVSAEAKQGEERPFQSPMSFASDAENQRGRLFRLIERYCGGLVPIRRNVEALVSPVKPAVPKADNKVTQSAQGASNTMRASFSFFFCSLVCALLIGISAGFGMGALTIISVNLMRVGQSSNNVMGPGCCSEG